MKRLPLLSALVLMSSLLVTHFASAAEPVFLLLPVLEAPTATIPNAVRKECSLFSYIGDTTLAAMQKQDPSVLAISKADEAGAAKALRLTVLFVRGYGGGAWSGDKVVGLRADLLQGAATVSSKAFVRSSSGGFFGGFKGTCTILERDALALARDVAKWLGQGAPAQKGLPPEPEATPASKPQAPATSTE
ncbi:MAG: hypothetical protein ACJ8GW_15285 [Massilia sp.]